MLRKFRIVPTYEAASCVCIDFTSVSGPVIDTGVVLITHEGANEIVGTFTVRHNHHRMTCSAKYYLLDQYMLLK